MKYQLVKPIIRLKNVPNFKRILNTLPVRAKALYIVRYFKAFALTGRQVCRRNYPGRCPGLRASAPSGRAASMSFLAIRASWYGLLGFLQLLRSLISMRSHTAKCSSAAGETSDGPPTIE